MIPAEYEARQRRQNTAVSEKFRRLIREISVANPLWVQPRRAAQARHRCRACVSDVGWKRVAIIGLKDLLEPGIRQLSVADEDAQAAGVEKRLVNAADVVDDTGNADGIVRPAPVLAVDRNAARD